jgi:hypothetical protein
MGSVLNKKIERRCHVLTEEEVDNIGARLECSPKKLLAKVAQQADVLVSSARSDTKLLKLLPM